MLKKPEKADFSKFAIDDMDMDDLDNLDDLDDLDNFEIPDLSKIGVNQPQMVEGE